MVSYDDVIYFYKDKPNTVDDKPDTVNDEQPKDGCWKLAKTFFLGSGKTDDCIYSQEIKRRMLEGTLTKLATFKYFSEQEAFDLVLSGFTPIKQGEKITIKPSQKWHLYVSYLAYQEVAYNLDLDTKVRKVSGHNFENEKFKFGIYVKQKEYVKWMKEAAGLDENATWEDVKNKIEASKEKR